MPERAKQQAQQQAEEQAPRAEEQGVPTAENDLAAYIVKGEGTQITEETASRFDDFLNTTAPPRMPECAGRRERKLPNTSHTGLRR